MSIAFFRSRNLYKNSYFIQPQTLHKFLFAPIKKKLNITYNGVFDKAALMIRLAMFFLSIASHSLLHSFWSCRCFVAEKLEQTFLWPISSTQCLLQHFY